MERGDLDRLTEDIIGASIRVHKELGPSLLESTYEACLAFELGDRGRQIEKHKAFPVVYRGVALDCGYRIDLLVDDTVIVDLKAVDHFEPVHQAQLLFYLKPSLKLVGLLINFNVPILTSGIRRVVNGLQGPSLRPNGALNSPKPPQKQSSISSAPSASSAVNIP